MSDPAPNNIESTKNDGEVEGWYAALTNQPNSAKPQATEPGDIPIEVVQKVLKDADKADQDREADETQRDWQRLQFRLRKETIQVPKNKPASRDWLSPANRNLAMAAGVAAVMTVGLMLTERDSIAAIGQKVQPAQDPQLMALS